MILGGTEVVGKIDAVHLNFPITRGDSSSYDGHGCTLPRAILTQEGDDLPMLHGHGYTFDAKERLLGVRD
jgi:hypothetical protein